MEPILGFAALAGIGYAAYRVATGAARKASRPTPSSEGMAHAAALARRRAIDIQRRLAEARRRQAIAAQYRTLQLALLQLDRSPDFRRVASIAAKAAIVPIAYRRRLFVRIRPKLVAHFARCLACGTSQTVLTDSLSALVIALGVAGFEADYIRTAASAQSARPRASSPADRVANVRRDHDARVAAIRQGVNQDPEILEQLLEAENERYRQLLLSLFDNPASPASSPPA